jgi:ABC-type lipoprotein release transport system permease subunit
MLKLAWRNIWRNKSRSTISIAAVFFSVFLAILMRSFALGTYAHMIDALMGNYFGYVQVHANGYWHDQTLDNTFETSAVLYEQLSSNPNVTHIASRLEAFSLVSSGDITKGAMVLGINPKTELEGLKFDGRIISGSHIQEEDHAVVIGKGLAASLNVVVNDTLFFIGQGYQAQSAYGKYAVKGIVNMQNPELNKSLVVMPLAEAQWMFACENRLTTLALGLSPETDYTSLAKHFSNVLAPKGAFEVMTWEALFPDVIQGIEADSAGGLVFLLILYLIIAFVLFGTVIMLVEERKMEFGILISIGMPKHLLAVITLIENTIVAGIGGLAGILLSRPILVYFKNHPITFGEEMKAAFEDYGYEAIMPASTDWSISLTHGAIVSGIAVLVSLYAVLKIYNLNPINALRS